MLFTCVAAVTKHLRCVAVPLAVLRVGRLLCHYLTDGYQVLQSFAPSDYLGGLVLAERLIRHHKQDVLEQYLGGIDRGYKASSHIICF